MVGTLHLVRKNGITCKHRASCTLGNGRLLFYLVTTGRVLHEEHIELLMEEFAFLRREVEGEELLKGSLHFTGQCEAGLLATGEGRGKAPGLTTLAAETVQVRAATWAVSAGLC